jgi:enoyl-CoA hydratase/carnithine racemase
VAGVPDGVRVERDGRGIVTLTFDRQEVHNALDWQAMQAFAAAVRQLQQDSTAPVDAPRAVIVTGAGSRSFCSGGDQMALVDHTSAEDGSILASLMGDALRSLEELPIPVIAAVNGHALGGGAEVALACDLRIAAEDVRFGLVHVRLGIIPGWGAGQRLLRLVGYAQAMEILLTGKVMDASELARVGLVNQLTPPGGAMPAARSLAEAVADADPNVVRAIKRLLRAGVQLPPDEALELERSLFPSLWAADAHVQAMRAFATRRR